MDQQKFFDEMDRLRAGYPGWLKGEEHWQEQLRHEWKYWVHLDDASLAHAVSEIIHRGREFRPNLDEMLEIGREHHRQHYAPQRVEEEWTEEDKAAAAEGQKMFVKAWNAKYGGKEGGGEV